MGRTERRGSEERSRSSTDSARDEGTDGPGRSRSRGIERLHRQAGNQAVKALHEAGDLQASLTVSQPTDPAEREAERVAETVVREQVSAASVDVERTPTGRTSARRGASDANVEATVKSATAGGRPLPETTRDFFGSRFDRDFSDVRVHTGTAADRAARSLDAEAFTVGRDIAFARGKYRPDTRAGKELLAHELTHVAQQNAAPGVDGVSRQMVRLRPERGAGLSEVKAYLACNVCRPGPGEVCGRSLDDRTLRILISSGWRPALTVGQMTANMASTIVAVDEQVAHSDAIQTYLKVEFLVQNAELVQGHTGNTRLSYPGERPEFNSFYEELGDQVLQTAIGELLPLSNLAGFALDTGLAIFNQYIADENTYEEGIRRTIISRLDDELDEDIPQLYEEGRRAHRPLKERRNLAREYLWDLPGAGPSYDLPRWEAP
ncbi:MAG: DUF4157 domain-containing protein [Haloarculaceae archaeon]